MRYIVILAGLAITIAAGVAWFFIPSTYRAVALLRVSSRPAHVLVRSGGEAYSEFAVFKRTQIQLIRSNFVLTRALGDASIGKLETILEHDDPTEWLNEQLLVDYPDDSEILRVALTGTRPDELVKIVDATVRSYFKEVVERERDIRSAHERKLQDTYDGFTAQCKADEEALHKLELAYKTSSTEAAQVNKRVELKRLGHLMGQRDQLDSKLTENAMQIFLLEARQEAEDPVKSTATARTSAATEVDTLTLPLLKRQREFLEILLKAADDSVKEQQKRVADLEGFNVNVAAKVEELRHNKSIIGELREELDRLRIERLAPERVIKLDDATEAHDHSAEVKRCAFLLLAAAVGLAMVAGGALGRLPRKN